MKTTDGTETLLAWRLLMLVSNVCLLQSRRAGRGYLMVMFQDFVLYTVSVTSSLAVYF